MIDHRRAAKVVLLGMLSGALLVVLLTVLTLCAHASPSVKHQNSLGVVISDINENAYVIALPIDGKVFDCGRRLCTNLSLRPFNTDMLYTEQLLLCGNEADSFKGMTGVLALTYRRQASFSAGGVGCHDLVKVFQIEVPSTEPPIQQEGR